MVMSYELQKYSKAKTDLETNREPRDAIFAQYLQCSMTIQKIELPIQQSRFVSEVRNNHSWLHQRLQFRDAHRRADRSIAVDLVRETMASCSLSAEQEQALVELENGADVIVTGQQVGFLGGALYNLYKAATTISRRDKAIQEGYKAVSVFWIEDNDHDVEEAAKGGWFTKEQGIVDYSLRTLDESASRPVVSSLHLASQDMSHVQSIVDLLGDSDTAREAKKLLADMYHEGRLWSESFVHLLQQLFASHGLLLLRASLVRTHSAMWPIVEFELNHPGLLQNCVDKANVLLLEQGFHAQAKASPVNLFYHEGDDRLKVQSVENEVVLVSGDLRIPMKQIVEDHVLHSKFSPSVLLRPIVQDFVLGSSEYVGGPSELAYLAQLREAYEAFDVPMPTLVLRSGATVLTRRTQRLLDKEGMSVQELFRPWSEIEAECLRQSGSDEIQSALATFMSQVETQIESLTPQLLAVDKTLQGAIGAMSKSVEKEVDTLRKKTQSALKRKIDERLQRRRECVSMIFPEELLQERKLSPIYVCSEVGLVGLGEIIRLIAINEAAEHYLITVED